MPDENGRQYQQSDDAVEAVSPYSPNRNSQLPDPCESSASYGSDGEPMPLLIHDNLWEVNIRMPLERLVEDDYFQTFIISLIVLSSILTGVATFESVQSNAYAMNVLDVCDIIFLYIFTVGECILVCARYHIYVNFLIVCTSYIESSHVRYRLLCPLELAFNLVVYNRGFFHDGWRAFDFVVVLVSWAVIDYTIVRSFRIFRTLRLFARVQALKVIIGALYPSGAQVLKISMLLLIIFYIFGVMFTELLAECSEPKSECYYGNYPGKINHFGRLDLTLNTLFLIMNVEDWAATTQVAQDLHTWVWLLFIVFIMMTWFLALNLIVAVICDALVYLSLQNENGRNQSDVQGSNDAANADASNRSENDERVLMARNVVIHRIPSASWDTPASVTVSSSNNHVVVQSVVNETIDSSCTASYVLRNRKAARKRIQANRQEAVDQLSIQVDQLCMSVSYLQNEILTKNSSS